MGAEAWVFGVYLVLMFEQKRKRRKREESGESIHREEGKVEEECKTRRQNERRGETVADVEGLSAWCVSASILNEDIICGHCSHVSKQTLSLNLSASGTLG